MRSLAAIALASAVATTGCLPKDSGGDVVSDALPLAEDVKVKLPENGGDSQAALGELAEYYALTRGISREFNTGAGFVLLVVHTIVQFPATTVDGNSYTWGPWSDPLDPADYRLTVVDNGDGTYDWSLDGQSKIDPASGFLTAVSGTAVEGAEPHRGSGNFLLDFDNMKILDPIEHADSNGGTVAVVYDLENRDNTQAYLEMHIEGFDDDGNAVVADYLYAEDEDRSGDFQFSVPDDIDDDGSAVENVVLRSRWRADGSGRGDGRVSGGDLGDDVVTMTQCWDTSFRVVYETSSPEFVPEAGDANDCAFADLDLPDL